MINVLGKTRESGWLRDGSIPLLFKEGGCAINKKIPFLSGADGVVSNSNKIRIATRAYKEATRPFTNHPGRCAASPPLKGGE
jgi:hypothetical protein